MLRAVNQIADAVKESHPHILIDTFAYINTLPAPRVTKPRDNVVIRICSELPTGCVLVSFSLADLKSVSATVASCNFAAPYADPVNGKLFATMKAWGKIAKNIAVWDYITNVKAYIILPRHSHPHPSLSPPSTPTSASRWFSRVHRSVV